MSDKLCRDPPIGFLQKQVRVKKMVLSNFVTLKVTLIVTSNLTLGFNFWMLNARSKKLSNTLKSFHEFWNGF